MDNNTEVIIQLQNELKQAKADAQALANRNAQLIAEQSDAVTREAEKLASQRLAEHQAVQEWEKKRNQPAVPAIPEDLHSYRALPVAARSKLLELYGVQLVQELAAKQRRADAVMREGLLAANRARHAPKLP